MDAYLSELEVAGYLTIQRRWRPDGGNARNLYILEWEPQDRTMIDRDGNPDLMDDSVSAGQHQAQDSAHGVAGLDTHAQDSAHTHAHLGEEINTKKEPPPGEAPVRGVGGPGGPRVVIEGNIPNDVPRVIN